MPGLILGGASISYGDTGSGDAVLLVHGWIGSGALWDLMVPGLSETFRVIVPDLPGHADSGIPAGFAFDLEAFSRFIEDMRLALDLPRLSLVGHSLGGCICLHYATRYPEGVRRLVLIDTLTRRETLTWPAKLPFIELFLGFLYLFWGPRVIAPMIKGSVRHPEALPPAFLDRATAQASKLAREALLKTTHQIRKRGLGLDLGKVAIPVLVIHGDSDRSVRPAEAYYLRDTLRDARLRLVPDCGHCPNYEYPDLVNGLIRDFLAGE